MMMKNGGCPLFYLLVFGGKIELVLYDYSNNHKEITNVQARSAN
jgi:hypothetical protein